jgi:hypothetical protein
VPQNYCLQQSCIFPSAPGLQQSGVCPDALGLQHAAACFADIVESFDMLSDDDLHPAIAITAKSKAAYFILISKKGQTTWKHCDRTATIPCGRLQIKRERFFEHKETQASVVGQFEILASRLLPLPR